MSRFNRVKRSHSSRLPHDFDDREDFFSLSSMDGRMATQSGAVSAQRRVHSGTLQKRCRLSWRPRHVELVSDPTDLSGEAYCFHLHIYDPRKRILKDRIPIKNIVTIRASRDCYFQLFLASGKIVQFRTMTMDSQAHWMAMLKVALGKGCIFHVRLSTTSNLDHATLYSISVNLPAHRSDQLDRVLVVASPINDINLYAWDINKVKRFIELDIGIRMELCHSCYRGRSMTTTFILEKHFVKECVAFLCRQANITDPPSVENGLFIYTIANHKCYKSVQEDDTPTERDEVPVVNKVPVVNEPPPIPPRPPRKSCEATKMMEKSSSAVHVCINNSNDMTVAADDSQRSRCFTNTSVDVTFNRERNSQSKPFKPVIPIPEHWDDYTGSDSGTGETGTESLFMADGSLTKTQDPPKDNKSDVLPPRTIPRKNHESSIPAAKQPYYNYQPHLFNHRGNNCFDAPYQISSRIIIKDSGEVQFERNIMGNQPPKRHGGFHFKQQIPIPPRGIRANTDLRGNVSVGGSKNGDNPSWQTNFNFQSNAAANLKGNGSQFSHEVSASMNATVDLEAPPIPPRPPHKSSSSMSTCSSLSTNSHSSRATCKSPVPLPRSNVSSSSIRKSPTDFESVENENEAYTHFTSVGDPRTQSHLASIPQPKTFPLLPRQGLTFGISRTNSDSELESYDHQRDGQRRGARKPNLTKPASEVSDQSDAYVVPTIPPLGYSRSDSRNTLSPPYVDDLQFTLATSNSPEYLTIVEGNEEAHDGETILTEPSAQREHRNGSFEFKRNGNELVCHKEASILPEHEDKECDFEDAASIAFIQSSYRQRCSSASSAPQGVTESASVSLFASYSTQISLESIKPEIPPRKFSSPVTAKERDEQIREESASLTSSQETRSEEASVTSGSDQSVWDSHSLARETVNNKEATKIIKPVPRPRCKAKVSLSKSLNILSSSDSNLLDSVNDAETSWSLKAGQKSNSLSTRFFLDETGIGVSEL